MPRFFFNLRGAGELIVDSEGQTFRSIALAKKEALQAARDLIADTIKAGRIVDRARVFEGLECLRRSGPHRALCGCHRREGELTVAYVSPIEVRQRVRA